MPPLVSRFPTQCGISNEEALSHCTNWPPGPQDHSTWSQARKPVIGKREKGTLKASSRIRSHVSGFVWLMPRVAPQPHENHPQCFDASTNRPVRAVWPTMRPGPHRASVSHDEARRHVSEEHPPPAKDDISSCSWPPLFPFRSRGGALRLGARHHQMAIVDAPPVILRGVGDPNTPSGPWTTITAWGPALLSFRWLARME